MPADLAQDLGAVQGCLVLMAGIIPSHFLNANQCFVLHTPVVCTQFCRMQSRKQLVEEAKPLSLTPRVGNCWLVLKGATTQFT